MHRPRMLKILPLLLALLLLLCACSQESGSSDLTGGRKSSKKQTTIQKYESSIFGRNIKYENSFTPADNIALPIESSGILDMVQIEKSLYFLGGGAVYSLDLESASSAKLFDTDANMFAAYDGSIYTYDPTSGKICAYSVGGELMFEKTVLIEDENLVAEALFVTDDYFAIRIKDNSRYLPSLRWEAFNKETLEKTATVNEKSSYTSIPNNAYTSYKGNSILKAEENAYNEGRATIYEINLDKGKCTKVNNTSVSCRETAFDIAYNSKTDTVVFFVGYKNVFNMGDVEKNFPPYICEYSFSDPDNIVRKRFVSDYTSGEVSYFVGVYENIISAAATSGVSYVYYDYLNPPESITFACRKASLYEDIIFGFEAKTGILVRTVSFGEDINRLDIKLMAGDTDFDLFEPVYLHQHKYFSANMFEDLSKYPSLKQRLDGDLAASYVSNLSEKYVGMPTYISTIGTKETAYVDQNGHNDYSERVSWLLYLAQNIDIADGVYKDEDGSELYKLLKFLYDNPEGNEDKMPFGKEIDLLDTEFILMNPSGVNKENSVKFLEYMFDVLNGDIEGVVPQNRQYINIDSTDGYYIYWRLFAWDYIEPLSNAKNTISQCDGKNSTQKEIARKAAMETRMRLKE